MDKNIKFQHFALTQTERAIIKQQTPMCLWMTGLSGAGKSTLANALEQELNKSRQNNLVKKFLLKNNLSKLLSSFIIF